MKMTFAQQLEQRGLEKGIQQGIEQGMEQGIQAGIYQEKLKNAKLMLNEGISFVMIKKFTGLSDEVLATLV